MGEKRLEINMVEENDPEVNKTKIYKIILLGLLVHLLLLIAVFDVYFASPLDHGMTPIRSTHSPPAKRLVLMVADGLRAEAIFGNQNADTKLLVYSITKLGSWGVVHTRVPTETRPGHVALLAGIYEDPSAIFKGWKANPVHFDSVINQSRNAWAWGSPEVINSFNKDNSSKVHLHSYGTDIYDFGKSNTGILDIWVFRDFANFLSNEVLKCGWNCDPYYSGGNIFFLHLVGIDLAGHGFKPHSKEYNDNIQLVLENIHKLANSMENVFSDASTTYIFTADHGMTDWGSHGAGSAHETEVPLIVWGAGIKRSDKRWDINQIDITPLIASLIGINIPINSLGYLPTEYLDVRLKDMAKMVLSNTLQLYEIFSVKCSRIKNNAMVFFSFRNVPCDVATRRVEYLKGLLIEENYIQVIDDCQHFRNFLRDGVNYYHNYYQYPVLISVSVGFVIWIMFLGATVLNCDKQPTCHKNQNTPFTILIIIVIILCYKSEFPLTYYFHFMFPFVIYFLAFKDSLYYNFSHKFSISTMTNICFYVAGIELLVYGFFNRIALTIITILLGIWILIPTAFHASLSKKEKIIWLTCCLLLAIFPALPVMKTTFNVPMYVVGYVGWVTLFLKMYLKDMKVYQRMEYIAVDYKVLLAQFVLLQVAAVYVIMLEYGYILPDSNLKYLSWVILIVPISLIPFTSTFIVLRLVATFFGFAPFYLLVSPNYEVLFSVIYISLLCTWLLIETKTFHFGDSQNLIYFTKFENYKSKNEITSEVVRRAFFFMVFISLGFFGTGNIASMNSFDPMWVRAFLTVFSPFRMIGLIMLKLMVPFIFSCSIFRAINSVGKENVMDIFCIILIFSDLMVLQFLYMITNVGSWLDIGTSLSHFIIMEGFVTILLILYGAAHWLTSVSYNFKK
ncbi:hypothetical protein JTB14_004345 [Gonioctena quinquepunctata]|nr:hypothetical protein JTB14_004345 [Gonioctena quinquepunctata]